MWFVHKVNQSRKEIYMEKNRELSERLLDSWLNLSMNLWNERLVSFMSYNEALVCHLLYQKKLANPEYPYLTLMQLSNQTRILKSQMNKTIASLESKGFIERERHDDDKRIINISLSDKRLGLYVKEHINVLRLVDGVIEELGEDRSHLAIEIFDIIARRMAQVEEKGKQ